mgnify:CR=1 FL=1
MFGRNLPTTTGYRSVWIQRRKTIPRKKNCRSRKHSFSQERNLKVDGPLCSTYDPQLTSQRLRIGKGLIWFRGSIWGWNNISVCVIHTSLKAGSFDTLLYSIHIWKECSIHRIWNKQRDEQQWQEQHHILHIKLYPAKITYFTNQAINTTKFNNKRSKMLTFEQKKGCNR